MLLVRCCLVSSQVPSCAEIWFFHFSFLSYQELMPPTPFLFSLEPKTWLGTEQVLNKHPLLVQLWRGMSRRKDEAVQCGGTGSPSRLCPTLLCDCVCPFPSVCPSFLLCKWKRLKLMVSNILATLPGSSFFDFHESMFFSHFKTPNPYSTTLGGNEAGWGPSEVYLSFSCSDSLSKCRCSFWPSGASIVHTQNWLPLAFPEWLGERTRPMVALCTAPPHGAGGRE